MKKAYLDVETGGFNNKEDALLEIAIVPVIDGERLAPFVSYMMPPSELKIDDGALKVNGIKRCDILTYKPEKEVLLGMCSYLEKLDTRLVFTAYNAPFDRSFVKQWFIRSNMEPEFNFFFRPISCDILEKAKTKQKYFPVRSANLKLTTLTKLFKIAHDGAHTALSDVNAMIDLDIILDSLGVELSLMDQLDYRTSCKKFLDSKYIIFNADGDIFINKQTIKDPSAFRFILSELWEMYG